MKTPDDIQQQLVAAAARYELDPLGFVRFAFPWGRKGTDLESFLGPEQWQEDILCEIGDRLQKNPHEVIRVAVASGHGIGKSSLISMLINWSMSTMRDANGVVTAGKEDQLRTKTWPEVAKWHRLSLFREWFKLPATSMHSTIQRHATTWHIDATAWNAVRPEAFAGLHNFGKRILVIYDEASAVDDKIWETTEGALTDKDTQIIWIAFSNPTKNTGRFRECFGRFKHRWINKQIDSRTVGITNKEQIQEWIDDYGEESDFVKVRVRGQFPSASSLQFIGSDLVTGAIKREASCAIDDALIMGVDVARFGDDSSVIAFRKGRDATIIAWEKFRGIDTMQLAARVAALIEEHHVDAVFVDEGGIGGGVVDRLRMLNVDVFGVNFSSKADYAYKAADGAKYANKRAEMWGIMRSWLPGGTIPDDQDLVNGLTAVEYGYNMDNAILLERKEFMKKRGLASPDEADALALTFAMPVLTHDFAGIPGGNPNSRIQNDYDKYYHDQFN